MPNPGSQTEAYFSEADETGFGGEAGPGKTALLVGLALTAHKRSLILRKTGKEAAGLLDEFEKFMGAKPKLDRSETFRIDGRQIQIGGCDHEDDKQKYKGRPKDLMAFDEVPDFTESQYTFIIQWNRSDTPEQRCRVVAAFNPPTKASGLWVIRRWGPWLDPSHPRPAKSGEIRWFTTINGEDTEVNGPGPHEIPGEKKPVMAKSRTFIRGRLEENITLAQSGYDATRAAAPEKYRAAYRAGDFESALQDAPNQAIPTAWIRAAVRRWTSMPPEGIPQCALGADCTGGGADPFLLAIRYDGWYAPMFEVKGKDIPVERIGAHCAGLIMSRRKDQAMVIVDMGGGYGGSTYEKLRENDIPVEAYKGADRSTRRTRDGLKGFKNRRAEIIWKFREALDPDQDANGSPIMLPDDSLLIADLCSWTYEEDAHLITIESKESVVSRLGRSTDRGDAVVMAWAAGMRYVQGGMALERARKYNSALGRRPQVLMGRSKYHTRGNR